MNHIDWLLSGKQLLKEISSSVNGYRTWIEVSLADDVKPVWPFRTEPYAMTGCSLYINKCNESEARFKLRISSFLISDIENDYDPSYDHVGQYENIDSVNELNIRLKELNVKLEQFIDAAKVDDYPL